MVRYEGNVDIRIGTYRLRPTRRRFTKGEKKVVAEGSVVFDQADRQRITGTRAEWSYRTKPVTSKLNRLHKPNAGRHPYYFTADRVEKVSLDTIVATNVQLTACDEDVPKWKLHASKARIKTGDRVYVSSPTMR